ncbi:MAG: superinfection immunity protein [Pseudomonadota bacterium]
MSFALILNVLIAIVLSAFLAWLYLLPSQIALKRKHQSIEAVMMINIFLGITIIGWIGTLIWALRAEKPA